MRSAIIIGGGVVGLSVSLHLSELGWRVTVVERETQPEGCSFVNAGMIVPSHFVPLAAPGVIATGLKWMMRPASPFAIAFPRAVGDIRWLFEFARHANPRHVERSMDPLLKLHLASRSIYLDWAKRLGVELQTKGILMLYRTREGERHELETAAMARRLGLEPETMTADQIARLDPAASYTVLGGVRYPLDAHVDPARLMSGLRAASQERGAELVSGCEVTDIEVRDGGVRTLRTTSGPLAADEYVVAAGVWSSRLLRKIGVRLPLVAGKGYSFEVPNHGMTVPALLSEARVALTPLGAVLRVGGTMEIGNSRPSVNRHKIGGMMRSLGEYVPGADATPPSPPAIRQGLRPLSPDGLPYLGRVGAVRNLSVAAGHAMMGVSLAPASGSVIANLLHSGTVDPALGAFDPNRYR